MAELAIKNGNLDEVKLLLHDATIHQLNKSIIYAVNYGHIHIAEYLLNLGADINVCDSILLQRAASNGDTAMCKYLINQGADTYCKDILLHYAMKNHNAELFETL